MIREANKRAGNTIAVNEEGKEIIFEERTREFATTTLPDPVLVCALSRDTGLTGKEGWKKILVSFTLTP